jgi:hypothetical protein
VDVVVDWSTVVTGMFTNDTYPVHVDKRKQFDVRERIRSPSP